MKKLLALALLSVAFVGCGGKGGLPACTSKHEVKEILTGVKQGCSGSAGIVKAALATNVEEANDLLSNTFVQETPTGSIITAIRNSKFYTIIESSGIFYVQTGKISEITGPDNGFFRLTYQFVDEHGNLAIIDGESPITEVFFNFDQITGNLFGTYDLLDGNMPQSMDVPLLNAPFPTAELEDIIIENFDNVAGE